MKDQTHLSQLEFVFDPIEVQWIAFNLALAAKKGEKAYSLSVEMNREEKLNKYQHSLFLNGIRATEWTCSCKYERNWNMQEFIKSFITAQAEQGRVLTKRGEYNRNLTAIITSKQFNLAPSLHLTSRFGPLSLPTGFVWAHVEMPHILLLKVTEKYSGVSSSWFFSFFLMEKEDLTWNLSLFSSFPYGLFVCGSVIVIFSLQIVMLGESGNT